MAIPPESGFLAEYLTATHVGLEKRKKVFCSDPEFNYWPIDIEYDEIRHCKDMISCIRYAHKKYARINDKANWAQKAPKLVRTGQLWLEQMPDCKLIHMVRDPRAVVNSLRESKYHNLHIEHGSNRYINDTEIGLLLENTSPTRVMRLSYEGLISSPDNSLQRICNFMGLKEGPGTSEYLFTLTPNELKFGHHSNLNKKIEIPFSDKWESALNRKEIKVIEHKTAHLMKVLGYYRVTKDSQDLPKIKLEAILHHLMHTCSHSWKELTQRPDFFMIAKRRWQLGNINKMLTDFSSGL